MKLGKMPVFDDPVQKLPEVRKLNSQRAGLAERKRLFDRQAQAVSEQAAKEAAEYRAQVEQAFRDGTPLPPEPAAHAVTAQTVQGMYHRVNAERADLDRHERAVIGRHAAELLADAEQQVRRFVDEAAQHLEALEYLRAETQRTKSVAQWVRDCADSQSPNGRPVRQDARDVPFGAFLQTIQHSKDDPLGDYVHLPGRPPARRTGTAPGLVLRHEDYSRDRA